MIQTGFSQTMMAQSVIRYFRIMADDYYLRHILSEDETLLARFTSTSFIHATRESILQMYTSDNYRSFAKQKFASIRAIVAVIAAISHNLRNEQFKRCIKNRISSDLVDHLLAYTNEEWLVRSTMYISDEDKKRLIKKTQMNVRTSDNWHRQIGDAPEVALLNSTARNIAILRDELEFFRNPLTWRSHQYGDSNMIGNAQVCNNFWRTESRDSGRNYRMDLYHSDGKADYHSLKDASENDKFISTNNENELYLVQERVHPGSSRAQGNLKKDEHNREDFATTKEKAALKLRRIMYSECCDIYSIFLFIGKST